MNAQDHWTLISQTDEWGVSRNSGMQEALTPPLLESPTWIIIHGSLLRYLTKEGIEQIKKVPWRWELEEYCNGNAKKREGGSRDGGYRRGGKKAKTEWMHGVRWCSLCCRCSSPCLCPTPSSWFILSHFPDTLPGIIKR